MKIKKLLIFSLMLVAALLIIINTNNSKAAEGTYDGTEIYSFDWVASSKIENPGNYAVGSLAIDFSTDKNPYYLAGSNKALVLGISASQTDSLGYVYYTNKNDIRYSAYAIDYASGSYSWATETYGEVNILHNIHLDHSRTTDELMETMQWFEQRGTIENIKYCNDLTIKQTWGDSGIYMPDYASNFQFSLDNGSTWNTISSESYSFPNTWQVKFRNNDTNLNLIISYFDEYLNEDITVTLSPGEISENFTELLGDYLTSDYFYLSLDSPNTVDAQFNPLYYLPFDEYGTNMFCSTDGGNTFTEFNSLFATLTSETCMKSLLNISELVFKNDDTYYYLAVTVGDETVKIAPGTTYTTTLTEDTAFTLGIEQPSNKVVFTTTSDTNFIVNGHNFYYQINDSGYWVPIISSTSTLPYTIENVQTIKFKNNSDIYSLRFNVDIPDLAPKTESESFTIPETDDNITNFTFYLVVAEHEHVFVDGSCECGEVDPDYVAPHEHVYINGVCECGQVESTTGDSGGTDFKSLVITSNVVGIEDASKKVFYKTNLMTDYEVLNITTSSNKVLTGLDTITFRNDNPDYVFIIRYNEETIYLNYSESINIDLTDVYLMNMSYDIPTNDNTDDTNNSNGNSDNNDSTNNRDDLSEWTDELPIEVLIGGIVVIVVVALLALKRKW